MKTTPRTHFSHIGIHVYDIERMVAYYTEILGLSVTDRGTLNIPGEPQIVFLSADPEEHHQVALVEGRSEGETPAAILNQISFYVDCLDDVRLMKAAVEEQSGEAVFPMSHGNAWSIYFNDPEGNTIEVFTRSPFYVQQPVTDALNLDESDEEITAATKRTYEGAAEFRSANEWRASFAAQLESRWK